MTYMMKNKPEVKKITDLKDKLEAYRASALAAGKVSARPSNLALASAAAGGAALAMAPAAEAVIQYSGLQNIELTPPNEFKPIDIDGDGDIDLEIYKVPPFPHALVYVMNGASLIKSSVSDFPKALSANYNIANTLNTITGDGSWAYSNNSVLGVGINIGQFPGAGNSYIGVRFINGDGSEGTGTTGLLHYGWVQVNVHPNSTSVAVLDWAWEDTPNTPILAGATHKRKSQP